MLLIEHHLEFVLDLCDRLVLLESGVVAGTAGRRGRRRSSPELERYLGTYLVDFTADQAATRDDLHRPDDASSPTSAWRSTWPTTARCRSPSTPATTLQRRRATWPLGVLATAADCAGGMLGLAHHRPALDGDHEPVGTGWRRSRRPGSTGAPPSATGVAPAW